jgi:hypothetical protein
VPYFAHVLHDVPHDPLEDGQLRNIYIPASLDTSLVIENDHEGCNHQNVVRALLGAITSALDVIDKVIRGRNLIVLIEHDKIVQCRMVFEELPQMLD